MEPGPSPDGSRRWRRLVLAAALIGGAGAILAAVLLGGTSPVVSVEPGMRLLGLSRGVLTWMSPNCSVWHARLEGGRAAEPAGPIFALGECPLDNPRFDGEVVYSLGGVGRIWRHAPDRRTVLAERDMAFALALDERYLYLGTCRNIRACRIERLPADGTGKPELIQAGIVSLANMEVDGRELFWVARGSPKQECETDPTSDPRAPVYHCRPPVPPRLMAAPKDEPRAVERVLLDDFDGRRPFLGARHVYWLGAGGVHRVPKAGGAAQLVLPATTLTGFAADGDHVYLATTAGIFESRDGEPPRPFELTEAPPGGLALDAHFIYWVDPSERAIVRRRR